MQWLTRTVLLLTLTSSALARKSDYWWLFPNFDENGSDKRENSTTEIPQDNLRNRTDNATATSGLIENVFNLFSNVNVDIEYENDLNENEGYSLLSIEDSQRDNQTKSVTAIEDISEEEIKDLDWAVDRDWASKENQSDATTLTSGDTLERDNETEIEQETFFSPEKLDSVENFPINLTNEEEDEAVHIDGDAHPSSKLEEEQVNEEEDDFSGDDDLQDEKAEIDELAQIFKEQDEAAHEVGDVHPSSKLELEIIELGTEDVEDLDFPAVEKDEPVHENGDAHPSSMFEIEENNYDIEEVEEAEAVDEISSIEREVVLEEVMLSIENVDVQDLKSNDEEGNNSSSEESQDNEENLIKENSELFESSKDDYVDYELTMEDVSLNDGERQAGNVLKPTQDDEASLISELEIADSEEEIESIKSPLESDYGDIILHWVNDDLLETDTSTFSNKSSKEDLTEDTSPAVPIAPIFNTPLCSFDTRPFDLAVLPVNSISGMHGADVSLLCQLVPHNESERIPYFRLTWLFEKEGCQKNASDKNACTTVLTSKNFEAPYSSDALSYGLTKLNHTIHTGLYICDAEIYGCQSQNLNATRASQALYLKVYTKPNYGLHIGVISSVCVLLLAILAGLVSYARRVQRKSKNRYQELLSPADIQYYPSKVLELPNSVYNTTTTGFVRMSASTFSSKSSFTSNEEDA